MKVYEAYCRQDTVMGDARVYIGDGFVTWGSMVVAASSYSRSAVLNPISFELQYPMLLRGLEFGREWA